MGRVGIYLKEKTEQEVRDIVQVEIQNGALPGEVNLSSMCNTLIEFGLLVYKSNKSDKKGFNQEVFNRDLIKKVSGTREGMMILMTMMTEMYLNMRGAEALKDIEAVLNQSFEAINNAEDEAESAHFVHTEE
ncbi:conjugal transfer protein [Metakosakonia massiliensis]|uniref:Relaxosome protein TraM n=1 Tax=Phytobacter massiliensis TaxID=1485952 RepID=A0A6N3EGI9_9ENTR